MKRNFCIILTVSLMLLVSQQGCKRVQHITISGTVYLAPQQGGSVTAADGAKITVSTDVNGNGRIDLRERATATADSTGHYTIYAPVAAGMQSVVRFSVDGYAPLLKTVQINTTRAITGFDGTLVEMDSLTDAKNGKWRNQAGSVEISSSNISGGRVRIFNPATEADKFPGSFSDNKGSLLISGVFTAFELQDAQGKRLATTEPGNPARIRMRMPRDTWGAVIDTNSGNDRIDVPMYYFNEETGQWERGTTEGGDPLSGWLERDNGTIIAESQLAAVRNGSYSGDIFTASDVTHFSYWNVDWPIESHACISGTLVDGQGNPVAGATINVQGLTYTGRSSPQTTGDDGKFCVDVMRSEAAGEDVNNNGVTGETQKVLITGSSGGKLYKFGEYAVPESSGTCPDNCLAIDLAATPDKEVQVSLCAVSGTASVEGVPTAGISIYAHDDLVDPDTFTSVCGDCTYFALTDASGAFTVTSPYALSLMVNGYYVDTSDGISTFFYTADRTLTACPSTPVDLNLALMFCMVNLPEITYAGSAISVNPATQLSALMVIGQQGQKWIIFANTEAGFSAPVTYGELPAGALQSWPMLNSAPAAITTGDTIIVVPLGGYMPYKGKQCYSSSQYIVP